MTASDYSQQIEAAVDDPSALAELETAIEGDAGLDDMDRDMLLGRIGQYEGQTAKASYDPDDLAGEEDFLEPAGVDDEAVE